MALIVAFDVIGTGLKGCHHHRVCIARAQRVGDLSDPVEHEGHGPGRSQIATMLGEIAAHVGGCPVQVIRHRFHNDGDPVRAIALIADFRIILGVAPNRLLDRAVDHILGHGLRLGGLDRKAQARVLFRIGIAHFGRNRDLFGHFGEHLGA